MLFLDIFSKTKVGFKINKFLITANQIKLKYSLLTSPFIQCCNKDVIIHSGASVPEFIRANCSFISIDVDMPTSGNGTFNFLNVIVSQQRISAFKTW